MTQTTVTKTITPPSFTSKGRGTGVKQANNSQNKVDSVHRSSLNPYELTKKYNEEREKRLRYNTGLEQYRAIDGEFAQMLVDPFVGQKLERSPVVEDCEVLVVGAGFGAQLVAVELLKSGIEDIRIVEKAGDFGGTWYWNRYPGAQCDIESYVYMPLLEEMDYIPSQKYAGHEELLRHSQAIGRKYGLYEKALFQTEVRFMHWREDRGRWEVETDRGDIISARFAIPAAGPLHRPKLPGLPGLGSFQGHTFHTSRWDYNYTGGDPAHPPEDLVGLSDKRVGVIGTGATSVQIVPHLGRWSKQLFVFQRTPSSIDVRGNRPTDPEWVETLGEHWQKRRMDNFNIIVNGGVQDEDLVSDGWTDILRKFSAFRGLASQESDEQQREKVLNRRQMLDFEKMEQIRARVDEVVEDAGTAESLKPYYNQFCKRPCFHDEYLPTFNRPNVKLVDTSGRGVERITERGVVANGKEYELDCLIFATGFELATGWTQKAGIEIFGRNSLPLSEKWKTGPSTLHGHSTRGFPNLFFVMNTQAALSPNFLHVSGFQAQHLSYIIGRCINSNVRTIEPTQEAEDAWVQTILDSRQQRKASTLECTPGYYNNEGQKSDALDKRAAYGGGALEFMRMMTEWRAEDRLAGLEMRCW